MGKKKMPPRDLRDPQPPKVGHVEEGYERCPFTDVPGQKPCRWHTYAGCSTEGQSKTLVEREEQA